MSELAVVVRSQWRLYAWGLACVALVLAVSVLGALLSMFGTTLSLCLLPALERAFANLTRAKDGGP